MTKNMSKEKKNLQPTFLRIASHIDRFGHKNSSTGIELAKIFIIFMYIENRERKNSRRNHRSLLDLTYLLVRKFPS